MNEVKEQDDLLDHFMSTPRFTREKSFEEDLEEFVDKWRKTEYEIYVKQMMDNLITFNHYLSYHKKCPKDLGKFLDNYRFNPKSSVYLKALNDTKDTRIRR